MDFKFIERGWEKIFKGLTTKYRIEYKFISPFIQFNTIRELHKNKQTKIKLITRYNLNDFYNGVSSLQALKYIISNGGEVKGIKNLHSKLYIFNSVEAILSSANLTQSALLKNFEFGMQTSNLDAMGAINDYFKFLWEKIPHTLNISEIEEWEKEIDNKLKKGKNAYKSPKFRDYGFVIDKKDEYFIHKIIKKVDDDKKQYFIKFFGTGNNRVSPSSLIWDEVQRSGCHWACSYPENKKPRRVRDGDIMFMSRLTLHPNDIMIFGYAIASKYKEGRDDATIEDIELRKFKAHWPRYIRVHSAQLIDGQMSDGVSLNQLMRKFKFNSFLPTARNKTLGKGNIDPKKAYGQQAAVQLTELSAGWLLEKVEDRIQKVGRISNLRLADLD